MDSSFSSSSAKPKTKLSVRNQTRFKKSSFSSAKNTNISMREQTMLNKAYELSTLCDIEACVLYYGRDGELIKTWPEDQSKVRDMAERFSKLSDNEKRKKSTNLSQFLNKKMNDEKKWSLDQNDNRFSEKVLKIEHSLETRLQMFQDKLRLLLQTEPDQVLSECGASRTEQNHNFTDSTGFFSADSCPSLINDSLNHHDQSKFSIFIYNHDNGSFSQLGDSVSSFDQAATAPYNNLSMALLGPQGFGCSNNMVISPQMQTQNPLLYYNQFSAWNQTPSFGVQ